ncbi:hypothetical protein B0H13DRAFT_1911135 [Mycena leptocephala]|nr:hypothetical protein B0H13DRAFT_1911135 [Mycena leptocephala]
MAGVTQIQEEFEYTFYSSSTYCSLTVDVLLLDVSRDYTNGYNDYEKTITWQATSRARRSSVYAWEGQDQEEPRKDAAQRYRRRSLRTSLLNISRRGHHPRTRATARETSTERGGCGHGVTGDAKEEGGRRTYSSSRWVGRWASTMSGRWGGVRAG